MNPVYLITSTVLAVAVIIVIIAELRHGRGIKAVETKTVHLKCAVCGLLVARYEQGHDLVLRCVNCIRTAEKNL